MIQTKKDLRFYIAADRIMNGYKPYRNLSSLLKETLAIGGSKTIIIKYLLHLRRYAYYYNTNRHSLWYNFLMVYEHWRLSKYAIKAGFSIGQNALEYGVVIPHYGTIVVNPSRLNYELIIFIKLNNSIF